MNQHLRAFLAGVFARLSLSGGVAGSIGRIGLATAALISGQRRQLNQNVDNQVRRFSSSQNNDGNIASMALLVGNIGELNEVISRLIESTRRYNQTLQSQPGQRQLPGATFLQSVFPQLQPIAQVGAPGRLPPPLPGQAGGQATRGGGAASGTRAVASTVARGFAIATLVAELAMLPKRIHEWSAELLESRRHLAQYNGTIASAFASLDASRLHREIGKAQATSDSAKRLAEAVGRFEEATQHWQAWSENVQNEVSATLAEGAADFFEKLNNTEFAKWVLGVDPNQKQIRAKTNLEQFAQSLARGDFGGRHFPPQDPPHNWRG